MNIFLILRTKLVPKRISVEKWHTHIVISCQLIGVSNKNKQVGCVLYFKGKPNAEMERFAWITQNMFTPFVWDQQLEYSGYDVEQDSDIPEKEFDLSYCDGNDSQLKSILAIINHYSENDIIANKHNASISLVEQMCDGTKRFPPMEKYCKTHTVKNIPTSKCPIKMHLEKAFTNLSSKLCIKIPKKNSLIDFLSVLPTILTCAMIHENNIIHGFISNGFLDDKSHWFPVMNKILGTCCRMPTKEQYDACLSTFPILFEHFYNDGHVSDKLFEQHGIPKDIDIFGSVRVQYAGMTQENQQQAKTLNHATQITMRKKMMMEIDYKRWRRRTRQ